MADPSAYSPAVARALEPLLAAEGNVLAAVSPARLLAALLAEEHGRVAVLLQSVGVDPATARTALAETAGGADLAEILRHARGESRRRLGDPVPGSEHVLLAAVQLDATVRTALNLDPARLSAAIGGDPADTPIPAVELGAPTEWIDGARILDVAANRAREALRVVEDYCRFVLDDALLCGELKGMRHELTAALELLPARLFLAARDTEHDVGTGIMTAGERERGSLVHVAAANLKRLQESLRSLEEFGKRFDAVFAGRIEQLRYRAYTLERAVVPAAETRARFADARLYVLLTGSACAAALDWTIAEAAAGGAQVIQLREKHLPDRELLARARDVRRWTRRAGVLFLMNDRPDIARLAEADGVHLGQDDLTVRDARRVLGTDALIGVSTHDPAQLRQAVLDGADYVGIGPCFPSRTKDFAGLAGLDYVRAAAEMTSLPAFAIGGINASTIDAVIAAGARRVAVSHAIAAADDPRQAASVLRQALEAATAERG